MLRIKPKSEVDEEVEKKKNSTEVLKEISKSLQLKPFGIQQPNTNTSSRIAKNRPYYYTYGSTASAMASNRSCATPIPTSLNHSMNSHSSHFNRSASVGCVIAPNNRSLSDVDLSKSAFPQRSQGPAPLIMNQSIASSSVITNTLYNIEEDKEVENPVIPTKKSTNSTDVVDNRSSLKYLDDSDSDDEDNFGPVKVKSFYFKKYIF